VAGRLRTGRRRPAAALVWRPGETAARLARSLGHLSFARRFLPKRAGITCSGECTATRPAGGQDFLVSGRIGQIENRGQFRLRVRRFAAAARAAAAGDPGTQAARAGRGGVGGARFPAMFEREISWTELLPVLEIARTIAHPRTEAATAQLAAADGPDQHPAVEVPDVALFTQPSRRPNGADDPLLISAASTPLAWRTSAGRLARTPCVKDVRPGSTVTSQRPATCPGPVPRSTTPCTWLRSERDQCRRLKKRIRSFASARAVRGRTGAAPPLMIESKQIVAPHADRAAIDDAIAAG